MEILSLNVNGATFLDKRTSKLEEFKSVVSKNNFQILCLSETMSESEPGAIDGYTLVDWRAAYKRGMGRPSGGLAVYCKNGVDCNRATEENLWHETGCSYHSNGVCKLCRFFLPFVVTHNGENINVCLVYLPPYDGNSKEGYDIDFIQMVHDGTISTTTEVPFIVVNNVLKTWLKQTRNIIVIGDLNATTEIWNLSRERRSKDTSPIDHFGQRLLSLCKEHRFEILNGCTTKHDSKGEPTCGKKVVDYALVHTEEITKYDFRVFDINYGKGLFDHNPIAVKIGRYENEDTEARAAILRELVEHFFSQG